MGKLLTRSLIRTDEGMSVWMIFLLIHLFISFPFFLLCVVIWEELYESIIFTTPLFEKLFLYLPVRQFVFPSVNLCYSTDAAEPAHLFLSHIFNLLIESIHVAFNLSDANTHTRLAALSFLRKGENKNPIVPYWSRGRFCAIRQQERSVFASRSHSGCCYSNESRLLGFFHRCGIKTFGMQMFSRRCRFWRSSVTSLFHPQRVSVSFCFYGSTSLCYTPRCS